MAIPEELKCKLELSGNILSPTLNLSPEAAGNVRDRGAQGIQVVLLYVCSQLLTNLSIRRGMFLPEVSGVRGFL